MTPKAQFITTIFSLLIALGSFSSTIFIWNQDKDTAMIEKQAQQNKEIQQSIQDINKELLSRLEAQKKAFNNHLLESQRENYEIRQELSLVSSSVLRAQRQYEYVQTQSKLDNEAMKKEIIREIKKK